MIEPHHPTLSVRAQCALVGLPRASFYYAPAAESALNLHLMRLIDEPYTRTPFYGYPRMSAYLPRQGYPVNEKRIYRRMQMMGLQALYPKPRTSLRRLEHTVYP